MTIFNHYSTFLLFVVIGCASKHPTAFLNFKNKFYMVFQTAQSGMLVLVVMIPVHMFSFSKTDTESTSPGERASLKEALYRERQTGSWLRE